MKKILYLFLAGAITVASCKKKDPEPTPEPAKPMAKVMFANTCIDVSSASAKINDTPVSSASGIAFLANTGYISVNPSASAKVSFASSSNLSLQSTTTGLTADNSYSAFLTGVITKPEIVITSDDLTSPTSGMAKVRFVHVSNDTLNLTAAVGNTTVGANIKFKQASPFVQVAAGSSKITVGDPANFAETLVLENQQLDAGKIYTIIKTGIEAGTGSAAYKLSVITNK